MLLACLAVPSVSGIAVWQRRSACTGRAAGNSGWQAASAAGLGAGTATAMFDAEPAGDAQRRLPGAEWGRAQAAQHSDTGETLPELHVAIGDTLPELPAPVEVRPEAPAFIVMLPESELEAPLGNERPLEAGPKDRVERHGELRLDRTCRSVASLASSSKRCSIAASRHSTVDWKAPSDSILDREDASPSIFDWKAPRTSHCACIWRWTCSMWWFSCP